ncbi:GAF domain-containing sensor histidine kinase [Pedobacter arcticus]|uniref:GAF domain-containing sensor histidine kinase n=1 Tax=Pedobacter arcticus TaxID=752140 RepID=UPI0002E847FE|nr:GAF domain-containing sensor histidine kinase [Pedobacter arcticus]
MASIIAEVEQIDDIYNLTSILLKNEEDSLEQLLKAACKIFKAELGVICLLKDDRYIVTSIYSQLPYVVDVIAIPRLDETFCYHAIKEGKILELPDIGNSKYNNLICCDVLKVKSYIGIPLKFDNKDVGTINFSSREVRSDGYSKKELDLLIYLNQWVSQYLNRNYYKETLQSQYEELEAKNRALEVLMEENNQLTQILVHDLKSPLSNIKMLSYLFQDFAQDADSEELISIFNKSLDYVFHLIDQMETLNNMETLSTSSYIEDLDLDEFVQANLKDFAKTAEAKSINFNYKFDGTKSIVKTDINFLKRILYNLISNALKFSPFQKQIYVTLSCTDTHFLIAIKDEGPGIGDGELSLLFQKFVKLHNRPTNSESSSGLGLFIVKELLKKIGGEITVESELGKGSTFKVHLPFAV